MINPKFEHSTVVTLAATVTLSRIATTDPIARSQSANLQTAYRVTFRALTFIRVFLACGSVRGSYFSFAELRSTAWRTPPFKLRSFWNSRVRVSPAQSERSLDQRSEL